MSLILKTIRTTPPDGTIFRSYLPDSKERVNKNAIYLGKAFIEDTDF